MSDGQVENPLDQVSKTSRGFELIRFEDKYGSLCSLQQSSAATEECVWLGIEDANPKIMVADAIRMGLPTHGQVNGWVPFAIPDDVLLHTRMHLNRDQVMVLIRRLTHWVETGDLKA